jgi:cytochrome c
MHLKLVIASLACAVASVSAVAPATAQSSPSQRGQAIAERLCARCHSIAVEGESSMGLAPPFRLLPQRYPVRHLEEALAEGIVTGHPAMPRFTFTPAEIEALLTFIASLDPSRTAPPRKP